ncbi:MAG: hypothetical protein ACR2HJ_08765 [Fimbriimonadales bacterium]
MKINTIICLVTLISANVLYADGFEPPAYSGSAAGVVLSGQQGWFNPNQGTRDFRVHTYSGNAPGFAANPIGESQFIGGVVITNSGHARAQKPQSFAGSDFWTISYYMNARFNGTPPGTNSLAKFSLQPSETNRTFNATAEWPTGGSTTSWHYGYEVADASGNLSGTNVYPNTQWRFLPANRWFRFSTMIDFDSNMIVNATLSDLSTGTTYSERPVDWFLTGGSLGTLPLPTAIRYFVGGTTPGNAVGIDGLNVTQGMGIVPNAYFANRGIFDSGWTISLYEDDGSRLIYRPGPVFSNSQPPIELVMTGTSPDTTVSSLTFSLQSSSSSTNILQSIALFNYVTGQYEVVDTHQTTTGDSNVTVVITSNPSRFVNHLGNREVKARISYKASGAIFVFPWFARLDKVSWNFLD